VRELRRLERAVSPSSIGGQGLDERAALDILESSVGCKYFFIGCGWTRTVFAERVNLIFVSETVTFVI
jgi:hypothetical protein